MYEGMMNDFYYVIAIVERDIIIIDMHFTKCLILFQILMNSYYLVHKIGLE